MQNSTGSNVDSEVGLRKAPDERLHALSSMLNRLDEAARADSLSKSECDASHQEQLAQVRLGIASSLFSALQAKHPPTAAHCLRVALGCSSWAMSLELASEQRDRIEVAALLHDVGKIGVPDDVLLKPGKLIGEELLLMERHRTLGRQILSGCCSSEEVLDIVYYASAWFDGTKHGFDRSGQDLPLGARMIAIVDAFDAMTTDHVYRRAMSRERAVAELYEFAGSQFDPDLIEHFCSALTNERMQFGANVARRWLQQISPESSNSFWAMKGPVATESSPAADLAFHDKLLDSMHDGVVFVDERMRITMWNRATERLTGITQPSVTDKQWSPGLVQMQDEQGKPISDADCPVAHTMRSGVQTLRRLSVVGRGDEKLSLDVHIAPVLREDGVARGVTVVLHDASSQITLEERVLSLHERATRDPLTKCANRAEFDRVFPQFVETHLEQGQPCSMIMCDIDHFKRINDTYGHQAGDEALGCFGTLLRRHARAGDLVARYGGEEFVLLCVECDNATATRRAEQLRRSISEQQLAPLNNQSITASFGVTEVQGGDIPETFLRRADRALLQAKDNGRNIVVQLGTGIGAEEKPNSHFGWPSWFSASPPETLLERSLVTVVPLEVSAEKMRGFVADHHAEILTIVDNQVTLKIDGQNTPLVRRWSDRPVPLLIDVTFDEGQSDGRLGGNMAKTLIHVAIRPKRQRDRRRRDAKERAGQLLASLKSYLMASDHSTSQQATDSDQEREGFLRDTKQVLSFWLRK